MRIRSGGRWFTIALILFWKFARGFEWGRYFPTRCVSFSPFVARWKLSRREAKAHWLTTTRGPTGTWCTRGGWVWCGADASAEPPAAAAVVACVHTPAYPFRSEFKTSANICPPGDSARDSGARIFHFLFRTLSPPVIAPAVKKCRLSGQRKRARFRRI